MQTFDIRGDRISLKSDNIDPFIKEINSNHDKIDTIILSTKTFTEEAAEIMCKEIVNMKNLKNVDLSDTISGLEYKAAQTVLNTFVEGLKNLNISLLNLSDNAIGPEGISALRPLIVNKDSLENLILMNDGLSSESCAILADIYKEIAPAPLKKIHFDNNMSDDDGAKAIARLLTCTPLLEDFRWSTTRTHEDGGIAISQSLSSVPHLKRLYIADNYFSENCGELLYEALVQMNQLEYLVLSDISLENEGVEYVLKALIESQAPIRHLDLSFNDLDNDIMDRLVEFLSQAEHLETLVLNDNQFASSGTIYIANALKKYCPHLKSLNLSNNDIGSKAAVYITSVCAAKESFETLHINGNCIFGDSVLKMKELTETYNKPDMIQSLDENFEDDIEDSDEIDALLAEE